MFWLSAKRIIKSGITDFKRNTTVSLSSILIMTITLSFFSTLIFFQAILHFSLDEIRNKVDVSVYFTTDAQLEKIMALKSSLDNLPEVGSTELVSAYEAIANFRAQHANDHLTLQALDELDENPL